MLSSLCVRCQYMKMRGMAFTAQADPTTFATQPCPIVPEAEHAACLQLPTQCRGQSACQLSTGRKKRGQCTSSVPRFWNRTESQERFYISVTRQGACLSQEVSFNILKCGREGGKNCHTVLAATPACPDCLVWDLPQKGEAAGHVEGLRSEWHVYTPLLGGEKVRPSYCRV